VKARNRRDFLRCGLTVVGVGLVSGYGVALPWQQTATIPRIGIFDASAAAATAARWGAVSRGLAELG
jgi:hypothetical protein